MAIGRLGDVSTATETAHARRHGRKRGRPVTREVCREEKPSLRDVNDADEKAACFREDPDHEYWESEPLEGAEEDPAVMKQ